MPRFNSVLTETQYKKLRDDFVQFYDPSAPELTSDITARLDAYENERKDRGLPVLSLDLPLENAENFNKSKDKFDSFFENADTVNTFFPNVPKGMEKIFVVEDYLSTFQPDTNLQQYAQSLNIPVKDFDALYENVKKDYNSKVFENTQFEKTLNDVRLKTIRGEDTSDIFMSVDETLASPDVSSKQKELLLLTWKEKQRISSTLKNNKPLLDNIKKAIDENSDLKPFLNEFKSVPTWQRNILYSHLDHYSRGIGEDRAKKKSFLDEVLQSGSDTLNSMFGDMMDLQVVEKTIPKVKFYGNVNTNTSEIKTKEDATAFVQEQMSREVSISVEGSPEIDKLLAAPKRMLSKDESALISDAILNVKKEVESVKDLEVLQKTSDPLQAFEFGSPSTWSTAVASTLGSSVPIMGMLLAPGGIFGVGVGYYNMRREELITSNPDWTPEQADMVASISAPIEALLDRLNLNFIKNLPNIGKLVAIGATPSKAFAKRFAYRFGASLGFETGVEVVQDMTSSTVAETLSILKEDFPDVEWTEDLIKVVQKLPEIGIGMIGLSLISSGGASAYEIYKDKNTIKSILGNRDVLLNYGFSEETTNNILTLINEDNISGATDAIKMAEIERNKNAISELANTLTSTDSGPLSFEGIKKLFQAPLGISPSGDKLSATKELSEKINILFQNDLLPTFYRAKDRYVIENKDGTVREFKTIDALKESLDEVVRNNISERLSIVNKSADSLVSSDNELIPNTMNDADNVLRGILLSSGVQNSVIDNIQSVISPSLEILKNIKDVNNNSLNDVLNSIDFSKTTFSGKTNNEIINDLKNRPERMSDDYRSFLEILDYKTKLSVLVNGLSELKGKGGVSRSKNIFYSRKVTDQKSYKDFVDNSQKVTKIVNRLKNISTIRDFVREKFGNELKNVKDVEKEIDNILKDIDKNKGVRETTKAFRATLRPVHGTLTTALRNNAVTMEHVALADAILGETSDITKTTETESTEKVSKALDSIDNELKKLISFEINNISDTIENSIREGKLKPSQISTAELLVKIFKDQNASGTKMSIYKKIYTADNIPTKDFKDNIKEYVLYSFFGDYRNRTVAEQTQILERAREFFNADVDKFIESVDSLVDKTRNALEARSDVKKALKAPKKKSKIISALGGAADSFLVINSLLERAFMMKDQPMLINHIQNLMDETDSSLNNAQDESFAFENEINSLIDRSFGLDELQLEVGEIQGREILPYVGKIRGRAILPYSTSSTLERRLKVYEELTTDNIEVETNIPGSTDKRKINISKGVGAYILNIWESGDFGKTALKNKGITENNIKVIRENIGDGMNNLRIGIRKLIREQAKKTNKTYNETFGFGILVPDENYFPMRLKVKDQPISNSLNIYYQSGRIKNGFENLNEISNQDNLELDLDLDNPMNNVLSVGMSHIASVIYQRNVIAPVTKLKAIFADEIVSDRITNTFGKKYLEQIFSAISAIESNGIDNEIKNEWIRNFLSKGLTATSRGAMGYRLSTIGVNVLAGLNPFLDSSIPLLPLIKNYAIANPFSRHIRSLVENPIIRRRLMSGSDTLAAISQATDYSVSRYNNIKDPKLRSLKNSIHKLLTRVGDFGNKSLQSMSKMDAFATAWGASAAYLTHYENIKKENQFLNATEEVIVEEALKRTSRTVNKTAQPTLISKKSQIEQYSNSLMRLFTQFKSEQRKNLGLEISAFRNLFNKEFNTKAAGKNLSRILLVNHVITPIIEYYIRGAIMIMLGEDPDEVFSPERLFYNMAVGPIFSGVPLLGIGMDYLFINLLNKGLDTDIETFRPGGDSVTQGLTKIPSGFNKMIDSMDENDVSFELLTDPEFVEGLRRVINGVAILPIPGQEALMGAGALINIADQVVDSTFKED